MSKCLNCNNKVPLVDGSSLSSIQERDTHTHTHTC